MSDPERVAEGMYFLANNVTGECRHAEFNILAARFPTMVAEDEQMMRDCTLGPAEMDYCRLIPMEAAL